MSFRIATVDEQSTPIVTVPANPRPSVRLRHERPVVYKGDQGEKGDPGEKGEPGDTVSNYVVFRKAHEPNTLVFVMCEALVGLKCIRIVARGKGNVILYFPSGHVMTQPVENSEFMVYELNLNSIIFPQQFTHSQLIYVFSTPESGEMVEVMTLKVIS